jgi:hypothetical protein
MEHAASRFATALLVLFALLPPIGARAEEGLARASGPSPFSECNLLLIPGEVSTLNAEVEPWVAVNPRDPANVVGVWQQDRFTFGGSRGLVTSASHDGGRTWNRTFAHFSRCAGGNAANGGDYERASDPWVTFSPNGVAYQIALVFDFFDFPQAVLVSRSTDGGDTWSQPTPLIRDTDPTVGDDKESITADPVHSRFVYAVWDRLQLDPTFTTALGQPAWFSRTTDGGETWEPARVIYDPQPDAGTIANQIAVLPNGALLDLFVRFLHFNEGSLGPNDIQLAVIHSSDKGRTWSQPVVINTIQDIGVVDVKNGVPLRTGDVIPNIAVDRETGTIYVVWQDARFSGLLREGIAMSKSTDGGFSWSTPVQVNRVPTVQAFTASVDVATDGAVAITYYDFRNDTADPAVLLTDYWQITSHDAGATWHELHVAGPFDMTNAPISRGYFVGDYEALAHQGESFLPFFVMTNTGNTANPTDVFAAPNIEEEASEGNGHEEINSNPQSFATRLKAHRERERP